MTKKDIKLKGFTITQDSMMDRFQVNLDNGEWFHFKKEMEESWKNREFGLEKVVVEHLKNSLFKLGYKLELVDGKLTFSKPT